MLIVTIIIAAVVSGFGGSLIGGSNQKAPQLTMDVQIANSGFWSTSYFKGEVTGVDSPVFTRNLKLITSWTKKYPNGTTIHSGATTVPGTSNFNVMYDTHGGSAWDLWQTVVPQGYGPGVGMDDSRKISGNIFWTIDNGGTMYELNNGNATNYTWWGNYNLQSGTAFLCRPFGGKNSGQRSGSGSFNVGYGLNISSKYNYTFGKDGVTTCPITLDGGTGAQGSGPGGSCSGAVFRLPKSAVGQTNPNDPDGTVVDPNNPRTYSTDQMMAVLGDNWNQLRPGDIVNVKIIHIPSGKTIWEKDVVVEGTIT
ncbi:MAG: type IV pilin N-terminal domain-containing protein [Methanoregula sp.]|nr:type IV pilin N-terminal domain-containing protein [Methanoregula sp.]